MSRIGAIAAAPFLGGQFVALYRGATRVPTVPGKPVWDGTPPASGGEFDFFLVTQATPSGGSEILDFSIYLDGVYFASAHPSFPGVVVEPEEPGTYEIAVSAVNAIGEGPRVKHTYEFLGV